MKAVFKALFIKHFFSFSGIFCFVLFASALLCSSIAIRQSAKVYEDAELERIGFGDVTFWVTKVKNNQTLINQISALEKVQSVKSERLIFADYEMNHKESDSEAQLVLYDDKSHWRFFDFNNGKLSRLKESPGQIESGSIFLPLSFISDFDSKTGDTINIVTARNGVRTALKVAGFFEDPIAGSTMIGMKTFLISSLDYEKISSVASNSGIDSLARSGLMIHVSQKHSTSSALLSDSEFIKYLNDQTMISRFTEQVHSRSVMQGFMLILQNTFSAIFASFTLVLFVVIIMILVHTIKRDINSDKSECGILKELGYTSRQLSKMYVLLFSIPLFLGTMTGFILSFPVSSLLLKMTATSTGLLVPLTIPFLLCFLILVSVLGVLILFTVYASSHVKKLSPLEAIKKSNSSYDFKNPENIKLNTLHQKGFYFHLAVRQILSSKKSYLGVLFVSLLLVFFSSMVIRLNSWLGPAGEGLMDAFNPADHHLGVQSFGQASKEDFEKIIRKESEITGYYMLAMPTLRLNGVNYKANVISAPEEYHILRGKTCQAPSEIVLTEFLLSDLGLSIGDTVELSARNGSGTYTISGTYQCANDMGANFGMNREGYLLLEDDNPAIWCHHYFLQDSAKRLNAMHHLEEIYGTEIHVHENSWPGLYSIIRAMKNLIILMFVFSAVFIILSIALCTKRTLADEIQDLSFYSLLGWRKTKLRFSFALRFVIVSLAGAIPAILVSALFTDGLVDLLMKSIGISGFESNPAFTEILQPALFVVAVSFIAGFSLYGEHMLTRHKIP